MTQAGEIESQEERWQFEPENRRLSVTAPAGDGLVGDASENNEGSSPTASLHLTLAMTAEDKSEETEE